MEEIIKRLYHQPLISRIFHTLVYCLKRELKDCNSVLDLGCGPDSPIKYCNMQYSVGVDIFKPYLKESKKKKIHSKYILRDLTKLDFQTKSFDAIILIDVLEHLKKDQGRKLLEKAEKWARKKVIVSTPNGYLPQKSIDRNLLQTHRSGWGIEGMKNLGYKAYGMAGWKFLRGENISKNINQKGKIFATIRLRPKEFWLIISELTQSIIYYLPEFAFEIFYVKIL